MPSKMLFFNSQLKKTLQYYQTNLINILKRYIKLFFYESPLTTINLHPSYL
jgi:hypothetical protein